MTRNNKNNEEKRAVVQAATVQTLILVQGPSLMLLHQASLGLIILCPGEITVRYFVSLKYRINEHNHLSFKFLFLKFFLKLFQSLPKTSECESARGCVWTKELNNLERRVVEKCGYRSFGLI